MTGREGQRGDAVSGEPSSGTRRRLLAGACALTASPSAHAAGESAALRPGGSALETATFDSSTGSLPPDAPLPRRSTVLTGDGVRLSMLTIDAGAEAAGVPVLFVPGWCLPADLWLPQMRRLARARPVHALDPRGQGESEVPTLGYEADRRADDLFDAIGAIGRPVIVVAWSLAGIELLHGLPRRGDTGLAGVVLVDASVGEGPAGRGEGVAAFRQSLREDRAAALSQFARALFRRPQPAARIDALAGTMARVPLEASLGMLDWGLDRARLRQAARGLRCPVLLAITPQYREQARLHAAARPATRIELFQDAGHALFDDAPERFATMLAGFAAAVDQRR